MRKYVALLRGINVGGKNKVAMPILKRAFEENGFSDVVTYINSGNVAFSSESHAIDELITICEAIMTDTFMLDIPVAVVPIDDLTETLTHAPDWWGDTNKEIIHYAIFLIPPIRAEEVFAAVGEIKPEYEKIAHHKNIIFWSAPRKTFTKTRWSKIASSSVNNHVTIRTANTINKLLLLANK
ncbi:DUF1697 domain-containing protein [Candidatus Enterococcus clewellii]|uniref:DUF1697 domain-containing protein n=1 Tax=Candidatus Enterococcus clewellii TaxID=1834193 RepID=A0A242KDI9_9ENTE|nr:DUF1697 domain-containing protein [Enterococcus sp. 9E7_DIV0242]OTP19234.1 hypothetical protein A5888_001049 [Enterococcus sp. 9E7_DIV0242]